MRPFIVAAIVILQILSAQNQAYPLIYLYATDSEKAGGGPFVFQENGNRFDHHFMAYDDFTGYMQTNGQLVMSSYGCPVFHETVWTTCGSPWVDMGMCNFNSVFQGDPDTVTVPPMIFPPIGYSTLKDSADYVFNADTKLNHLFPFVQDTLIMTDIEFFTDEVSGSGFHIRQWWFLKPPHLEANGGEPITYPNAEHHLDWSDWGGYDPDLCENPADLTSCAPYLNDMYMYHAKFAEGSFDTYNEYYLTETICGPHGFAHYDYPVLDAVTGEETNQYMLDETVIVSEPSVIYVTGGPVRVHGTFTGQYTLVTDEYITYHRHAWNSNLNPLVDTLWCNIWITDDLVNAESDNGDMSNFQPDDECVGGSDNILGLVSGANIIIANSESNRFNIQVNAAIMALNESFAMHYWQNTCTTLTGEYDPFGDPARFCDPPYGDGRGPDIYYPTGNQDHRGTITLWGGTVQLIAGYMKRSAPGPYDTGNIGMARDYHYDWNLFCNPPPHFPQIQYDDTVCSYPVFFPGGCTDPVAYNYLPTAFVEDGSCDYGFPLGDVNEDFVTDVSDVVQMASLILDI